MRDGRFLFAARPNGGPIVETLRKFLDFAGEERIVVEPDGPDVYVFHVPLADGRRLPLPLPEVSTQRTCGRAG